jgi:type II secretory pathway component GspD/PulD (secretin)
MISSVTTQRTSDNYSGVPILSQIPIIRYLFGKKVEQNDERKLLIFISAETL